MLGVFISLSGALTGVRADFEEAQQSEEDPTDPGSDGDGNQEEGNPDCEKYIGRAILDPWIFGPQAAPGIVEGAGLLIDCLIDFDLE